MGIGVTNVITELIIGDYDRVRTLGTNIAGVAEKDKIGIGIRRGRNDMPSFEERGQGGATGGGAPSRSEKGRYI